MKNTLIIILLGFQSLFSQVLLSTWQKYELPQSLENKHIVPRYISVNQFGDIYILDDENYWLIYISGNGKEYRIAGGWGTDNEKFDLPTDLFASTALDVYVCDNSTHRIIRFDRRLNFIAELDVGTLSPQPIKFPYKVICNSLGELFIVNSATWEVSMIPPDAQFVTILGDAAYGHNRFLEIHHLAINPANNLAIIDNGSGKFYELTRSGNIRKEVRLPMDSSFFVQWWRESWVVLSEDGKIFILFSDAGSFQELPSQFPTQSLQILDFDIVGDDVYIVDAPSSSIFVSRFSNIE